MKKWLSGLSLAFLLCLPITGALAAGCTDEDGDGYYAEGGDAECLNRIGAKKEFEKAICDCPKIGDGEACEAVGGNIAEDDLSTVLNPDQVKDTLQGKKFNPGAMDAAGDYIDQNCDGKDSELVKEGSALDLEKIKDTVINFLIWAIISVSVAVLIWGGILYSTAAGEEEKTRKARKAMIGAVIGLVVGISAYAIVNYIITQFMP